MQKNLNYYLYTNLFSGLTNDQVKEAAFYLDTVDIHSTMLGPEPYPECTVIVAATNDTVPMEAMKLQLFTAFKIGVNAATNNLDKDNDLDTIFIADEYNANGDKIVTSTDWFATFVIDKIEIHSTLAEGDELTTRLAEGGVKQYVKIHGTHPIKYFQNYEGKVYRDDISGSIKEILEATPVFADIFSRSTDKIEDCDNNLATPIYRTTECDIDAISKLCSLGQIQGAPAKFFIDSFGDPVLTSYASLERQTPKDLMVAQSIGAQRSALIIENILGTSADSLIGLNTSENMKSTFQDAAYISSFSSSYTSIGTDGAFEALRPKHIADLAESNIGADFTLRPARKYSEADLYRLPVSKDRFDKVAATSLTVDSNIPQASLISNAIAATYKIDMLVQKTIENFEIDSGAHMINVGDIAFVEEAPLNSAYNGKYVVDTVDYRFESASPYDKPKGYFWERVNVSFPRVHLSRGYLDFKIDSDNSKDDTLTHYASPSEYLKFKS